MRVFVLCTGRCGSTTFSKACEHLTNYTSAHQSNAEAKLFDERFDYPENHIEVDNRLSWFLGELGRRFDATESLYVHLTRDPEEVAKSYNDRWNKSVGIIPAFARGVLLTRYNWTDDEKMDVCRFYVKTVNANITEFLSSRQSVSMSVSLEDIHEDFNAFLDRISAVGDLEAARQEWSCHHNASRRRL
jgi:hypothetical protein